MASINCAGICHPETRPQMREASLVLFHSIGRYQAAVREVDYLTEKPETGMMSL